ncbi:hypothetical protein ABBQ38_006310 [Trebouxia sp. C0009 RCD-2024]
MEDEPCHSPLQQQEAEQSGSHSSEPPQQPAWDPPRAAHISEDMGLLGFFADTGQQTQPPREELEKLLLKHVSDAKLPNFQDKLQG